MRGDIVILIISVFIVGFFIIMKRRKTEPQQGWLVSVAPRRPAQNFSNILFVIWLIAIFLPNVPVLVAPLTPAIQGKVIDAETKEPLKNINIKIGWQVGYRTIAGGPPVIYRTYSTKSNENGEFQIPRVFKPLSILAFPLFYRAYEGIRILAYGYDYEFKMIWPKERVIMLSMNLIKNEKNFLENILKVYWEGISSFGPYIEEESYKNVTIEEKRFMMNAYSYFEKRFPNANYYEDKSYFGRLANTFDNLKEPVEAIKINQLIIQKYPSSVSAEIAKKDIERLEKVYKLKTCTDTGRRAK